MRDAKAYFYDSIADEFDAISNQYDTRRRVEVVFDDLLAAIDLRDRAVLDIGCGSGWFSQQAVLRGARTTALDIGVRLLAATRRRCDARPVAADACALPFANHSFDVIVSSECIEHTIDPRRALGEMCRVLRPGGTLVVTVPNQRWHFAVRFANALRLRPYQGYENWVRWEDMRTTLEAGGLLVEHMRGVHLFPFVLPLFHGVLRRLDAYGERLGPLMVNIAVRASRPALLPRATDNCVPGRVA